MADAEPWKKVFIVTETPAREFLIVEARGHRLGPPHTDLFTIRMGCMIQTVPAAKVYLTRDIANARVEELRKENADV